MAFTSLPFLGLLAACAAAYYLVPRAWRWTVLLAASMVFYWAGGGWTVLYVFYTAATVYAAGLLLGRLRGSGASPQQNRGKRRLVVLCACLLNFGLLYFLKYWEFTLSLLQPLIGDRTLPGSGLVLPLGVSFFMFQSVGYVVDVYRGKTPPERSFPKLLLFVSFFPQMVQGPIGRWDHLAPQLLEGNPLDCRKLKFGLQLMMWGYFKKLVIADRAAVLVKTVMDDPWSYGGAVQAAGVFFYCIQLYCDFSGGIDIARGAAGLFGIELAENFRRPLFSTSLTEFWRRWHITLGAWMRDYLFYPLSLSKPLGRLGKWTRKHIGGTLGKRIPTSLVTFFIYFVIGVWHGGSWNYIAYGFWNGTIITASMLLASRFDGMKRALHIDDKAPWYTAFQIARTCLLVFLGRYITRAPRVLTAFWMMKQAIVDPRLPDLWNGTLFTLGASAADLSVALLGMAVVVAVEWYQERGGQVRASLERQGAFVQWLAILAPLLILYVFGVLRPEYISSEFIYKNF